MIRMLKRSPWIALGAAAAWLLDGERGAARRAELASTVRGMGPRGAGPVPGAAGDGSAHGGALDRSRPQPART